MIRKRIEWVDWVKGICTIFVVMCHLGWPELYERILNPIFLSAFFTVSGYMFSASDNFGKFIVKKAKGLIVPMIIFGTINAFMATLFDHDSLTERMIGLFGQRMGHNDDLWFIACLFSSYVLFYIIHHLLKTADSILCGSLLIAVLGNTYITRVGIPLPWQLEKAFVMLPFLAWGYLLHDVDSGSNSGKSTFKDKDRESRRICACGLLYLIFVFSYDNNLSIYGETYGIFMYFITTSFIGVLWLIYIGKSVSSNDYRNRSKGTCKWKSVGHLSYRWIIFIGQYSVFFYAFQSKVIRLVRLIFPLNVNPYLMTIVLSIIVCLILSVGVYIYVRIKEEITGRGFSQDV